MVLIAHKHRKIESQWARGLLHWRHKSGGVECSKGIEVPGVEVKLWRRVASRSVPSGLINAGSRGIGLEVGSLFASLILRACIIS